MRRNSLLHPNFIVLRGNGGDDVVHALHNGGNVAGATMPKVMERESAVE